MARWSARPAWARLRREGEPWWRVVLTLLALAACAGGLLALAAHWIATPWQATIVLAAGAHYLMWTVALALPAAAVARRWMTLAGAALIATAVLAVQLPGQFADDVHGTPITVLQANLKVGSADPGALVSIVRSRHVELLATEELTLEETRRLLTAGLPKLLPYHYIAPLPDGGGGLGLWSRYPLRDGHNLPHFRLGVLTATVAAPGGDLTAVAAHVLPPYPYPPREWRAELARLRDRLRALPTDRPTIVAGDFNATVDHAQFRGLLEHGYADAAEQGGAGYLPTYPNDRWYGPLIAIDHVLTRGTSGVDEVVSLDLPGSDHRALLARVYRRA